MHFTSRHYLLLSAGKADGDSQNQSGTRFPNCRFDAEHKTGDFLYEEMKRIGLQNVTKDEFWLDSWTFERAVLRFQDQHGELHTCQMGAYQTNFETDGFETYDLVYVGRGTASDYEGLNVRGKLVLADINQRDEWWINYPVYQAYLKGAVGLIAVQTQGYAEIDPRHSTLRTSPDRNMPLHSLFRDRMLLI